MPNPTGGLSRRDFVKAAVAIGGASALSAYMNREQPDLPQGPDDVSSLPERQHAWDEFLDVDDHGNTLGPRHRVVLLLNYAGDGTPTDQERQTVEQAFQSLERAYPHKHEGLLFTVSYSPYYFDRFDESLPEAVDLPKPEAMTPFEDPQFDDPDAVLHLASDYGSVVLAAEEVLLGNRDELNGVTVEANLDGILTKRDRRTGFVGTGLPADNQDVQGIPDSEPVDEEAPLHGVQVGVLQESGQRGRVTIAEGPFAGGTTQHLSLLRLHPDQWYEQDSRYHRVATMFCPVHAEEDLVEGAGHNLGDTSLMEEKGCPAHTEDHAREHGTVGHSQKSARARENGEPLMIRRDFDSTDDDRATLHFLSLQQTIEDFAKTREAMNGTDVAETAAVGQRTNNGILQYLTVERRGNYLLPPRSHRALPPAQPS